MQKKPQKQDQPDPRPVPPVRPDNDECCHSGCDPCVFDLYQNDLERYREALKQWQKRQPKPRH
ncbi:oxidoreductase-like domain-containing protein [Advenella alkanexedens]|uniref:Oxidoreductase-like domain-containing protein n=1 Tax=Advenella alkanexedens TaxID=1481665 RepID=A0ABS6NMQ1_9BURK|nr:MULTISPECIES: oxidoreductase-like domain-containing protein [Advenella]MBV4396916.1 oxidoreductase-like domain-containing protein [Advenella alkanexedens]MDD3756611.1 oxidoreductase-like domain-containing protein [Advenella sp.]WKU20622.1 oxidoreductase-like domain-containing protein [Advenella alkanexedens]